MLHLHKDRLYYLIEFLISCSFYFEGYLDDFQNSLQEYSTIQICFSCETCFAPLAAARASKAHQCPILALEISCLMEKLFLIYAC